MNNKKIVKKKVSILKKIKKILIKLVRQVVKFFKKLYTNFMELPKKTRLIIGVWCGVAAIVLLVIVAGSSNNKFLSTYKVYEQNVNDAALNYVKDNKIYPLEGNKLKLDYNALIDYGYLDRDNIDTTCKGFSIIYVVGDVPVQDESIVEYNVNTYLHCENYTTEGYNDYK